MRGPSRFGALLVAGLGLVGLVALSFVPSVAGTPAPPAPPKCSQLLMLEVNQQIGPAPLLVQFQLTSYLGFPIAISWDFGDGSYLNGSGATYLHPAHRYAVAGDYVATLEVSGSGETGACSAGIVATAPGMTITSGASATSGTVPLLVHFSATVAGGTGTFDELSWSFGDGGSAPGASLTHTYTIPGSYRAVFTAVDTAGDVANSTILIQVLAASPGPTTEGVSAGSLSIFGAIGAGLAVFAGAMVYVRGGYRFGGSGRAPPPDPSGETHLAPLPPGPASPAAGLGTELAGQSSSVVPYDSIYPPQMYRGRFLDLSVLEYDVLATSSVGMSEIVPAPPAPLATDLERTDRPKLSQRVLLHLHGLPRLGPDDIPTEEYTQSGMVRALDVSQSPLSNVLRRLTYSGLIRAEVDHVQGGARRLNVYRLTSKGELLAEKIGRQLAAAEAAGPADPGEPEN